MKASAFPRCGAPRSPCRGMTLLEICMVLFIIMLLLGATLPAIQSAFVEQTVRDDARQLSLMVKTAMIKCGEQHRSYIIDVTATTMSLHPLEVPKNSDTVAPASGADTVTAEPAQSDLKIASKVDPSNKLLLPDPNKISAWTPPQSATWRFESGELCPATHIRVSHGKAWLELSFNALTGNVQEEASYFP